MEPTPDTSARSRYALAAFLGGAGLTHFLVPSFYDGLIPKWLPLPARFWTQASGVAELAAGAALLDRRTARVGAWAALAIFVGVYPANIQDTVDHWPPRSARGVGSALRLPLQLPMFAWAWREARRLGGQPG